ncbi:MAG: outer membrane lipoprotein carrier protein LolA [Micavibrio sp.]|nr:MAG: outer membrane lipoprotein carrier protein LolA [Micavibrio sp.]
MFTTNISQDGKVMRVFFRLTALFFLCFFSAAAAAAPHPQTHEERLRSISAIESYLAELRSMQARFTQTAPDGEQTSGVFYMQRPGKMRFEYDDPIEDFIVADGLFIYFYDAVMDHHSSTAIGNSLADFILRDNLRLSGDVTVLDLQENPEENLIKVSVTQTADPSAGSITLFFQREPMRLVKWRIHDAQGMTTEVALWEAQTNIHFNDRNLFRFRDPRRTREQFNR